MHEALGGCHPTSAWFGLSSEKRLECRGFAAGAGALIAAEHPLVALLGAVTEPALLVNDVQ